MHDYELNILSVTSLQDAKQSDTDVNAQQLVQFTVNDLKNIEMDSVINTKSTLHACNFVSTQILKS